MAAGGRTLMPGQRLLTILGGALSVVLSLASAQTQQQQQQQGQRQVLSFGAEGDTSDIGGVFRRHLRGSPTGFGLSETVTTTTTPAKMTVSRGDLRSAEGAEAPAGKRARERGGGFGVLESAEGGGIRGVTAGATVPGGASREESERKAARAREVKQGSRGSNKRESGGVDDDTSSHSIAVIVFCIGAVTLFLIGWCWLSSVVVCMSWCVCKCAKRSSSSASGDGQGKFVDTYANAVQATLCGDLASVVCVSDEVVTVTSEDGNLNEPVPASQPCTPHPSGSSIAYASSNSDSKHLNRAAAPSASTRKSERSGGPDASSSSSSSTSSSSAFSAIFRRSLTATAVDPVTPPAQDGSNKSDVDGAPFDAVTIGVGTQRATNGSEFSQAEEKQGDASSRNSAVVSQSYAGRRDVRLFGGSDERASGRSTGGDERVGPPSATPARSWRSRLLARFGVTGREGSGGSNHPVNHRSDPTVRTEAGPGAGQPSQTTVSTSTDFSTENSSEGSFVDAGRCSVADAALVSHRRRLGRRGESQRRTVGPLVVCEGLSSGSSSSEGHVCDSATPAVSSEASYSGTFTTADNNHHHHHSGREDEGVPAASGSDGAPGVVATATGPTEVAVAGSHPGGAPENVQSAPPAATTSADVGSAAKNPTAPLPDANTTADAISGSRNDGGGREGEARPASGIGSRHEATSAMVPREGGGTAERDTADGNPIGGPAGAPAGSLGTLEAQTRSRNRPEGSGVNDTARNEGGTEQHPSAGRREEGRVSSRFGDTQPELPALPMARVLWRAFSEVDHEKIGETHRLAAQRHQARFGPTPGVQNPPVCHLPVYNPL